LDSIHATDQAPTGKRASRPATEQKKSDDEGRACRNYKPLVPSKRAAKMGSNPLTDERKNERKDKAKDAQPGCDPTLYGK
jgi:hypothetical protein